MSHGRLREIRLRDFRCFGEPQTARLAPLTLLVGENSTGKTSFLAAVQAVWDAAHGGGVPDFRRAPFDLGSFQEIVFRRSVSGNVAASFLIGLREQATDGPVLDFDATFESRDAAPALATTSWRTGPMSVEYRRRTNDEADCMVFESPEGAWYHPVARSHRPFAEFPGSSSPAPLSVAEPKHGSAGLLRYLRKVPEGSRCEPSPEDLATFSFLSSLFGRSSMPAPPFSSAPNHPSPRRTYDPTKLSTDPWGEDVPSRFASLQFQGGSEWAALKQRLDGFGRESGLFDDFLVNQLTKVEGGPFQLQVRKFGKRGRKGPKRNLVDVGFGISQVLPVLAALFRGNEPSMFLLQQPELHLHPSAQAALGSLFCRTAEAGRQLLIETHSEYILDRIRMDIRDRQTALKPDDVSILYFERSDLGVRIHSLRFDDQGNVLGAPNGYGQFFMDEARRSVGL